MNGVTGFLLFVLVAVIGFLVYSLIRAKSRPTEVVEVVSPTYVSWSPWSWGWMTYGWPGASYVHRPMPHYYGDGGGRHGGSGSSHGGWGLKDRNMGPVSGGGPQFGGKPGPTPPPAGVTIPSSLAPKH